MKKIIEIWKNKDLRTIILTAISSICLIFSIFTKIRPFGIDMAWGAILISGLPIVWSSLKRLLTKGDIKAGLLVSIALIACIVVKEYFAAGEIVVIMMIGEILEDFTVRRSRMGLKKLIDLKPTKARVLRNSTFLIIDSRDVIAGDKIRIIAGETIPIDGIITSGETTINQSVMTGESVPVDKKVGDEVYCATTNIHGTIDIEATKVGENSSISKMIRMIEEAEEKKAPILNTMDRWASYLVITALILSLAIGLATQDVIRGITVLVVFCPCALVLATPTAIAAGIGNATKHGVIIKSGEALERLGKVTMLAFDKTGTLTIGEPKVKSFINISSKFSEDELIKIIAAAEKNSEHPYGKAIVEYTTEKNISIDEPQEFKIVPGKGVIATVNAQNIIAGNMALMNENNISITINTKSISDKQLKLGNTCIYISIDRAITGLVSFSDILRKDSKDIISALHKQGKKVVLLTGDNKIVADKIANELGIDDVNSDLLPEDKVIAIEKYEQKGEHTCMIGDGINDAPALKSAYVGVAMAGIGTDIAAETADIVLVKDDIAKLVDLVRLGDKVLKKINQNIIISLIINFGAIVLAAMGLLNPVAGALVHNVGSVLVVINAALLLSSK